MSAALSTQRKAKSQWQTTALAIGLGLSLALSAGCAGKGYKKIGPNSTTEDIHAEARDESNIRSWSTAIPLWEMLESKAAGTPLAQQAQLEKAYAYYKNGDAASALATIERFQKLHPTSPAMDYALYLKGIINFNDDLGLLGFLTPQDLSERDQNAAKLSLQAFQDLVQRFPESKYSEDSAKRAQYIINSLAQSEVNVAAYYYKRRAYVAAINRAQMALKDYPQTPAQESALYYLIKSYEALKMDSLAEDTRRVYAASYPQGQMLKYGPGGIDKPWWRIW